MLRFFYFLFIFAILMATSPGHAQMQVSGISIAADQSDFDNKAGIVKLVGHVQVIYNGYYISCNKATIHRKDKRIEASGQVIIQTSTTYVEAERVDFNLETELGIFYDGFIQSGKVVFEGDIIEKVGEIHYTAVNGAYTACTTCPASWSFSGRRIEAELGGYADIKYPILKVFDVPIFILPRLLVPLKSKRQSGFLVPSMRFGGAHGFSVSSHYFWALSRSTDLTLTATHYEKRGWKGLGEYRYVLSPESEGALRGAYIFDQAFKNCVQGCSDNDVEVQEKSVDRGFLSYNHYYLLPHNLVQRAEVKWISDLRYLRDFSDELTGHGESALENRLSLTKNTESQHVHGEVAFYTNLLKEEAITNNDDSVHRVPDLSYSLAEHRLWDSNLLFRFDLQYTNFNRNSFAYDDLCSENTTLTGQPGNASLACTDGIAPGTPPVPVRVNTLRDGEFNPGQDLIRTGQRLNLAPQLSYPIPIGNLFNLLPSFTYRETQYRFNAISPDYSPTAARRYVQFDLSLKTLFSKVYGQTINSETSAYKHEIEPEILYSQRPWARRPNHVFFGDFASQPFARSNEKLSDEDLFGNDNAFFGKNRIQFDYEDRLFDKKLVNFKLINRLVRKSWRGGEPIYENIASFSLSQSYDFEEEKNENPQPWSNIDAILNLRFDKLLVYSSASYYPYSHATNSSSRIRLLTSSTDFLEVAYTQSFTINDDNEFEFDKRTEVLSGNLGFNSKYLVLIGGVDYNNVTFDIQSWHYDMILKPPGDCWSLQFTNWFPIGGETPEFKFNFHFDFS